MWEELLAWLEKLIPQMPTRADLDRGFEGLLNKLPKVSRQADRPQPIAPLSRDERQAGQRALTPLERAEQINQQSAAGISRLQQMLADLGKPRQNEQPREASQGPSHVIVDNAKDLRSETPRESLKGPEPAPVAGESPSSRMEGLLKKIEQMQSPEWRSLSDADRNSRFSQRFGSNRADWSKLLRTNEAGDIHFRWQKPQQQPTPVPLPSPPTPRGQRSPKSLRQRLGTIWKWKTRPAQMVNWGRKLQIGAGRLMAMGGGNRVISSAATGMSRLGMLLQGLGTAQVGGVVAGLTGLALAAPAAVSTVWGLQKSLKAFGDGVLNEQKRLAEYSGVQARAAMITNISQIKTDMATARDTGEATVELAQEMAKFRQAIQPLESGLKSIEIKAATWGAQLGTAIADNLREAMAMPKGMWNLFEENVVENPLAWLLGGGDAVKQLRDWRERNKQAAQPQQPQVQLLPAQEFVQGLKQAMRPQGGQRKPLDPL